LYAIIIIVLQSFQVAGQTAGSIESEIKGFDKTQSKSFEPFRERAKTFVTDMSLTSETNYDLDTMTLKRIILENKDWIELTLPSGQRAKLKKYELYQNGFSVVSGTGIVNAVDHGIFYRGITDKKGSMVTLSIFKDEMYGVVSINGSNEIISPNKTQEFSIARSFNDANAIIKPTFECQAIPIPTVAKNKKISDDSFKISKMEKINKVINVYVECDFALFQNKGSVQNTVNYITSVFNSVAALYQNEGITIKISEVYVWTTQDPFPRTSSLEALESFRKTRTKFNGDIAHLAALGGRNLGGIAWLTTLCSPYNYSYSNIDANFNQTSSYSWTVEVVTHEIGHTLGSNHTHWCGWPGGAIDNCYTQEGSCNPGPTPTKGGTIMSYCHLTGIGINFNNGFGTLPGDRIRYCVSNSSCLKESTTGQTDSCYAPSGLTVNRVDTTFAEIGWKTAQNAKSYVIEYKSISDTEKSIIETTGTYFVLQLQSGKQYSAAVYAKCANGRSVYSNEVYFKTPTRIICPMISRIKSSDATTTSVVISWDTVQNAVYKFYYRKSIDKEYKISVALNPIMKMTNLDPNTEYTIVVQTVCGNVDGIFSPEIKVKTLQSDQYCESRGVNSNDQYIQRIRVSNMDNISGNNKGYFSGGENYQINVDRGRKVLFQFQGANKATNTKQITWLICADWNGNKRFDDPGETILSAITSTTGLCAVALSVPNITIKTRLRIVMIPTGTTNKINSCGVYDRGETEDYIINVK
jgi:hypothetical protein